MRKTIAALFTSLATALAAGDFSLQLPLACTLGKDCFIQQYVDRDPGEGARDFTCGPLSYDDHKGTDFALPSLRAMDAGVTVLAAAPGTVRALRDGEQDTGTDDLGAGKECGNGIVLDHGAEWVTQYCHLKRGSLRVTPGQTVQSGAPLAEVGLSGRTQFPHLHLSLRRNGEVIDPFAPETAHSCGQPAGQDLWQTDVFYQAGGLISLGVTATPPDYDEVKAGLALPDVFTAHTDRLVYHSYGFGARAGDTLETIVTWPGGESNATRRVLDRTQAQWYRWHAVIRPHDGWPRGTYGLTSRMMRNQRLISEKRTAFVVE